ncbi:MAG TPA: LysR family transcriptional regulator [Solirubrobacteraceae bacterium]|nr:LysR family transcriptional regulator [Solirubrobacteraceae bacterium]
MTSLRHLRYFVTVAEEGQLTRAASRLHIAQPALSQAISQLESQFGVELLTRHARGVSLTSAGQAFYEKARAALEAVQDADLAAQTHSRANGGRVEWGFSGWPPMVQSPELFAAFTAGHPAAQVSFRELSWPRGSTAAWLEPVDVALCFSPTPHPDVEALVLRREPRVVLAAQVHPLALKSALAVSDVLDETFVGSHPSLEPVRAGFWRLDDHRGAPARSTIGEATSAQETIAVVVSGRAITTAPASAAPTLQSALPGVAAIPLRDANPTVLALLWHANSPNQLVDSIVSCARELAAGEDEIGSAALSDRGASG